MIKEFNKEYRWLSNFHPCEFEYDSRIWNSSEHAYQAMKSLDYDTQELIRIGTAKEAKAAGKKIRVRDDWDDVKLQIMEEILKCKFAIPELRDKLLETKNEMLQEGNWWGDKFWGVDNKTGEGKNHLGKILMKIREEIKEELRKQKC